MKRYRVGGEVWECMYTDRRHDPDWTQTLQHRGSQETLEAAERTGLGKEEKVGSEDRVKVSNTSARKARLSTLTP